MEFTASNRLIQWLSKLANTGVASGLSPANARAVRLTNIVGLSRILSYIPYIVIYTLSRDARVLPVLAIIVVSILLVIPVFLLNRRGYHLAAAVLANLLMTLPVLLTTWLFFGNSAGSHTFFVVFALLPMITVPVERKETIGLLTLINFGCFLILQGHSPLMDITGIFPPQGLALMRQVSILASVILSISTLFIYQQMLHRSEARLQFNSKRLESALKDINLLATMDGLTKIANRHTIENLAHNEISRAARYNTPVSIIMLDLDYFKRVNDTLGHDAGDKVLVSTVSTIRNLIRTVDHIGRWGGEEFLIILPQTGLEGALLVAEKIRLACEKHIHGAAGVVTASLGVAEWMRGESFDQFVKRVDNATYRAKDGGRNMVSVSIEGRDTSHIICKINWIKDWETGNTIIDGGHREIIATVNHMMDLVVAENRREELGFLFDEYIEKLHDHYQAEEKILADTAYADMDHHIAEHRHIYKRMLNAREEFATGDVTGVDLISQIIDDFVIGHMVNMDLQFFPYL